MVNRKQIGIEIWFCKSWHSEGGLETSFTILYIVSTLCHKQRTSLCLYIMSEFTEWNNKCLSNGDINSSILANVLAFLDNTNQGNTGPLLQSWLLILILKNALNITC